MKSYTMPTNGSEHVENILSGRIKQLNGAWCWTEYHVSYAQQGTSTATNHVTLEEAEADFAMRLTELRKCWGRFTETVIECPTGRQIKFRSIRKNGKPGTLTGTLCFHKIEHKGRQL